MKCLSIILLLGLLACDENPIPKFGAEPQSQIVNGTGVRALSEISRVTVALIFIKKNGQSLCTGTILDSETVLTAAHCVDGAPARIAVVFGIHAQPASRSQMRATDRFVQHPLWLTTHRMGDLAVVHFAGGLPNGHGPVKLVRPGFAPPLGAPVWLAGYGVTSGGAKSKAGTLRRAESKVVGYANETQIVTDGHKSSVCFGDSGGPGFIDVNGELLQWGIAHAVANPACDEVSVHTAVAPYLNWIASAAREMSR